VSQLQWLRLLEQSVSIDIEGKSLPNAILPKTQASLDK
jgi:hypothetical protein